MATTLVPDGLWELIQLLVPSVPPGPGRAF